MSSSFQTPSAGCWSKTSPTLAGFSQIHPVCQTSTDIIAGCCQFLVRNSSSLLVNSVHLLLQWFDQGLLQLRLHIYSINIKMNIMNILRTLFWVFHVTPISANQMQEERGRKWSAASHIRPDQLQHLVLHAPVLLQIASLLGQIEQLHKLGVRSRWGRLYLWSCWTWPRKEVDWRRTADADQVKCGHQQVQIILFPFPLAVDWHKHISWAWRDKPKKLSTFRCRWTCNV